MGLLNKLTTDGSVYSLDNGATPRINPLAGKQSKLHADGSTPGYSLDGSDFTQVNASYQAYNDGVTNFLPQPSLLDINGQRPTSPLSDPNTPSINNSFSRGEYLNNLPG